MGTDGVFRMFAPAKFPTWRTLKPEVDGNSDMTGLSTKFQHLPPYFPAQARSRSHCRHRPISLTSLFQHGGHETGSRLHLRNEMSYWRNSNGYPHIFHHAQFNQVTGDIVRQLPIPYIDMTDTKPEVVCNSGMGWAIDAIPVATPTFSTMPDSPKSLLTSSDNVYYHIST